MERPSSPWSAGQIHPLAASLERPLDVGSNLRGRAGGGTLAYVLPDLGPTTVVCLGSPAPMVLETIRRLTADRRLVFYEHADPRQPAAGETPDDVAVLWVGGASGITAISGSDATVSSLLQRAGTIVIDDVPEAQSASVIERLRAVGREPTRIATTYAGDSIRTASPAGSARPAAELGERLSRWRSAVRPRATQRRSGLALLVVPGGAEHVPAWLAWLLSGAGVDVADHTWRLASPGVYDSQKVLLTLVPADGSGLSLIAKLTRDPRHNARLAMEASALTRLAALPPIPTMAIPGLVASGPAGPLFAVVETLLDGQPFVEALRRDRRGPWVDRVIGGLVELAVLTSREAPASLVAAAFSALQERYVAIHEPPDRERRLLDGLVERVARGGSMPIVAQHGDPGTWNLLALPDGRVGVLDWEAFEPDGPPLWDLWHFLRAALLDLDRPFPPRRRLRVLTDAFLSGGSGSDVVAGATTRYRQAVGIEADLIEPLFVFGWLHRALKESTRSRAGEVGNGHYAKFVRAILAAPDAPGLRRLQGSIAPG